MRGLIRSAASIAALAVLAASPLTAQLGSFNPRPGPQGTFAIRNARIVPVSGMLAVRVIALRTPRRRTSTIGGSSGVPTIDSVAGSGL